MRVYAVVSEQMSDEALELFVDRQMAELMVENWDRDEPDRAGELYVEPVNWRPRRTSLRPAGGGPSEVGTGPWWSTDLGATRENRGSALPPAKSAASST
jgi:hypothetical protein